MPAPDPAFQVTERVAAEQLIDLALTEDLADFGDVTSRLLIEQAVTGSVSVVSRETGVLAGLDIIDLVLSRFAGRPAIERLCDDGDLLEPGTVVATIRGPLRTLLTAERTMLNFLTALSGVATLTWTYVNAIQPHSAVLLDTRKTIPGYRQLQKYAVRCGGGHNHRFGLHDGILIKDNHLAAWRAAGHATYRSAIEASRNEAALHPQRQLTVEIEVDTLDQLREVLPATPDIVLLDNMSTEELAQAVRLRDEVGPSVAVEASGGITLETINAIAATGVDRISVGALTHSAPTLDLACDWVA